MINGHKYELLWKEDFKKTSKSDFLKNWNFDIGDGSEHGLIGWGNNELEYYTEDSVSFNDGLVISANRLENSKLNCYYGQALWNSGKIHTANKISFKYGRIEVKAKAPIGIGTWPAIWLLGCDLLGGNTWPNCGEIDILETTGANPKQVQGTIHGPGYFGENGLTKIIQSSDELSMDFHTFAIEWFPDRIDWFFDDALYNSINKDDSEQSKQYWPFNQEFYLILNLAIGGWFAGPVSEDLSSASFEVESIKYSSIDGLGTLTKH